MAVFSCEWSLVSLKRLLAIGLMAGLLGIACPADGIGQTPGYGYQPDQWASYESGPYLARLQKTMQTYGLSGDRIEHLHFDENTIGPGSVELFRLSRGSECGEGNCFFVLFATNLGDTPLVTPCQFKDAGIAHFFNPDRTHFWGFEFSCGDLLQQVKVSTDDFMVMTVHNKP